MAQLEPVARSQSNLEKSLIGCCYGCRFDQAVKLLSVSAIQLLLTVISGAATEHDQQHQHDIDRRRH
jgi:hypothetical protein